MMATIEKPNCRICLWRQLDTDGAHMTCKHPSTDRILQVEPNSFIKNMIPSELALTIDEHGLNIADYQFPWRFLPDRIVKCGGYKNAQTL